MVKFLRFLFCIFCSLAAPSYEVFAKEISPNLLNQGYYNIQKELEFKRVPIEGFLSDEAENDLLAAIKDSSKVNWNSYDKISFASFDLDRDSKKEVFAYYGKGMSCNKGCGILAIFKSYGKTWKLIGLFRDVDGEVAVLENKTKSFHDLAFSLRMIKEVSPDFEWSSETAVWNGESYRIENLEIRFNYGGYTQSAPLLLLDKVIQNVKFSGDRIYKTFYQKEFFTILSKTDERKRDEYFIGLVSDGGNLNSHHKIFDEGFVSGFGASHKYIDPMSNQWFVAVPFSVDYEDKGKKIRTGVGIAVIDSSGKRVKSQIVESGDGDREFYGAGFLANSNHNRLRFAYFVKYSDGREEKLFQEIDIASLQKVGNPVRCGDKDGYIPIPSKGSVSFSNGNRIAAIGGSERVEIAYPKMRDMTPEETMPNYLLESGDHASNPRIKACGFIFTQGINVNFTVLPNPNSVISLAGFYGEENKKVNIPVDSFDKIQVYSVSYNHYSHEDIMRGRFKPSPDLLMTKDRAEIEDKKRNEELSRRIKDCEIRKKANEDKNRLEMVDHDYSPEDDIGCGDGEEIDEEVVLECKLKHPGFYGNTVVMLPDNQILSLINKDPITVARFPEKFFSLRKN